MSHKRYSRQEDKMIADLLPKIGYAGLLEKMPHRTHFGIQSRAKVLRERGQMVGMAANDSPIGKPRQQPKAKHTRKKSRTFGMSRHDRYMAGESVGCV